MKKCTSISVSLILCLTLTAGCSSQRGTEQIGGATIGALLGLAGGLIADSDDSAMVTLGAGGALLGWVGILIMQSGDDTVAKADAVEVPAEWKGGALAQINRAESGTQAVQAGQALDLVTEYSLIPAPGAVSASVEEMWTLRQGDTEIATVRSPSQQRATGTWTATPSLLVPLGVEPGTYEVEHFIAVDGQYDRAVTTFQIAG